MKRFEYKELRFTIKYRTFKTPHFIIDDEYINILNEEGKKGWEVVNAQSLSGNGVSLENIVLLKREIASTEKGFFS